MKIQGKIGAIFQDQMPEIWLSIKKMHLGLSTYTFPWNIQLSGRLGSHRFSFREMLELTAENGIRYFQFGDNYPLHLLTNKELDELKKTASAKNISLQAGTRGLHMDNISRYLLIAKELETGFLRVVTDDGDFHPPEDEVMLTIRQLLPILKETGIVLAIENHDRFKAKTLVRIIEHTDPEYVAVCLDTANSLGAGEGINEILPLLLPYTVNLHIKDFTISRVDHKMGFLVSGAAAGEGMLDIPHLIRECGKYERCTPASLELWISEEASPEDTIEKELNWMRRSITFLNNHIQ